MESSNRLWLGRVRRRQARHPRRIRRLLQQAGQFYRPCALNPPNWAQPQVTIQDVNPVFSYKRGPNYDPPPSAVIKVDPKGGIVGQRVAVSGTAADFTAPRTQSWMFSVQRTVGAWLLEGDYNGSHGDHLVLS